MNNFNIQSLEMVTFESLIVSLHSILLNIYIDK